MADSRYPGFSQESLAVIHELENYGWTFTLSKSRHAMGKAPDGVTTCSVGRTLSLANRSKQNTEKVLKAWRRRVAGEKPLAELEDVAVAYLDSMEDPILGPVLRGAVDKHAKDVVLAMKDERHIVAAKPWLSRMSSNRKKGTTTLVENERVEERTWSDGVVDYACLFEGCDYVDPNPRAVAAHFGQKHTKSGEAEKRDAAARVPVAVDVPIDPETMRRESHHVYTPTDRLVAALAAFLGEHLTEYQGIEGMAQAVRLLVGGRDVELEQRYAEQTAIVQSLKEEVGRLSNLLADEREAHARVQADLDTWLSLAPKGASS